MAPFGAVYSKYMHRGYLPKLRCYRVKSEKIKKGKIKKGGLCYGKKY